jgi:hypothetical protein
VLKTQSADTAPAVEARLFSAYRFMEPWQKLRMVSQLSSAAFELAAAGIRLQMPATSDYDVQLILAARRLGRDAVLRATGRRTLPGE